MRTGGMFDVREFGKRVRRFLDGNYSCRKILLFLIVVGGFILYFGQPFAHWLFSGNREPVEAFEDQCIRERLLNFHYDVANDDATILNDPPSEKDQNYLPYIGNGVFGVQVSPVGRLYIRQGRTLSLFAQWDPLVSVPLPDDTPHREATVMHFTDGIVYKYQCLRSGYHVDTQYYAHRIFEGILVEDITIFNPSSVTQEVPLRLNTVPHWTDYETKNVNIQVDGKNHDYIMTSGYVPLPDSSQIIVVSILYKLPQNSVIVKPRSSTKIEFLTSISYSEPQISRRYVAEREVTQRKAIEALKKALNAQPEALKDHHMSTWKHYWHTGFSISKSKAKGALNGHKINSTIYYVLSQVPKGISNVEKSVSNNEGCYRGHHTLDATRLWRDTSTIDGVNSIVKAWLITLEKQGCHHLLAGGPTAVQQAIVLSLGGLRFSNQHVEFNIDPQYLHRDYLFRRISYGNVTHVNISVTVNEDNRAVLGVALDRSDSDYYACDAACLDSPVPLSQTYTNFPVKLTQPLTAILYITSDHQHMQDLRNALHVHTVDEAPAHDHHVMALHKHGHQLGGLPTFFWVSICFLIVVFHMFLCKLIFTEYYDHQDRQRGRYMKP
ncbi:uncharacterized protein KIAA2013 homolog [Diachasma alloeum]|uniref:uncharacterized protein KIAA2013 homolog n=1 Tax=Diachasma alloeum TaxID=454923 RepID=UPI0007383FC8|nr:uncharacterized protein KIAA2013 homolog [Diachasma alloeum]